MSLMTVERYAYTGVILTFDLKM